MSWDVLIINSNEPVDFEKGDWPDFISKQEVIENIKFSFPKVSWTNQSWGTITDEFADIEFNLSEDELIGNNFMLHVRGGSKVVNMIFQMCQQYGWIAYDITNDKFIDNPEDDCGLKSWHDFKNEAVKKKKIEEKKPWWKF